MTVSSLSTFNLIILNACGTLEADLIFFKDQIYVINLIFSGTMMLKICNILYKLASINTVS